MSSSKPLFAMKALPLRRLPALFAFALLFSALPSEAAGSGPADPAPAKSLAEPVATEVAARAAFPKPPTAATTATAPAKTDKKALGQEALDFFASRHQQVVSLLRAKSSEGKLAALVDDLIDYRELSRSALGGSKVYASKCGSKCAAFEKALGELIRRNYLRFIREADGHKVEYLGAKVGRRGTAVKIDTRVKTKKKSKAAARRSEVQVSYVLKKRGDTQWAVVDIITEGVSLRKTYRHEFEQIMAKPGAQGGIEGVIAQIQSKLQELSASSTSSAKPKAKAQSSSRKRK